MDECTCPDPALCARLKQHINGRLWEIYNNINIDPKTAQQYRTLWERQAKLGREVKPSAEPKRGCNCGK